MLRALSTLEFERDAAKTQKVDPNNEFAKDLCAFADASGGDLVDGIEERQHVALRPSPFSAEPFDACARRLKQVLADHVESRIAAKRPTTTVRKSGAKPSFGARCVG